LTTIEVACAVTLALQAMLLFVTASYRLPSTVLWAVYALLGLFSLSWRPEPNSHTPSAWIIDWYTQSGQQTASVVLVLCATATALASLMAQNPPAATMKGALKAFRQHVACRSDGAISVIPWLALLTLLVAVTGVGPQNIFHAHRYLAVSGPEVLATLGPAMMLPMTTALGGALAMARRPGQRLLAWFALVLFFVFFASRASRAMALMPILLIIGFTAISGRRPQRSLFVVAAMAVPVLLGLALAERSSDVGHGLLPYLSHVGSDATMIPEATFDSMDNVLFSIPLAGYVASQVPPLSESFALTSLNPLPGTLTNWSEVSPHLRVNYYIPFNALGELANYGYGFLFVYLLLIGLIFNALHNSLRLIGATARGYLTVLLYGMIISFAMQSLQYNLRSATRWIYYALAVVVVSHFLLRGPRRTAQSGVRRTSVLTEPE
jgi:hypothetical protein